MDALVIASFLSIFVNRIIEGIVSPIKKRFPDLDMWWLVYVSWVVGGVVGWASGINLLADYMPDVIIGRVMTAIVLGGGANLINDLFPGQAIELSAEIEA
jgi:hypothetical protein